MFYQVISFIKTKKYLPKNHKLIKLNCNSNNITTTKNRDIDRNRYSKKIPNNLDVIVIGSGIGGLSVTGFLSKLRYKVLVLEQHYIAGGCCHSFKTTV